MNNCPQCGEETSLVIDHAHTTGKVCGLLCKACNTRLGHFKDSKSNLMKALGYLDYE
jgi:transcription elongation factor Elf1